MKKKLYIQPNTKLHVHTLRLPLMNGGSEQGNDAGDSEARGASFMDDESDSKWGDVWN